MSTVTFVLAGAALGWSIVYPPAASAQTRVLEPTGEYATIDTQLTNETIDILRTGSDARKQERIEDIRTRPQNYAPPVFYVLSKTLFEKGERDDAAFWFYAGQLRARFDANRCNDPTAGQVVDALNQEFGPPINQFMFQDLPKLEALIPRVVAWDGDTPHRYDHRWINLSGMRAVLAGTRPQTRTATAPLSRPREQWDSIAALTRRDYLAGFRDAMGSARKRK